MLPGEKRRRYFQERLETPLHRMGLRGQTCEIIIKEFQRCLSHVVAEAIIPDRFYDIEKTIIDVAAKKGISAELVRSNIEKHAADFFVVHNIQFMKQPGPYTPSPVVDNPAPAKRSTIIHPPLKGLFGEEPAKPKPRSTSILQHPHGNIKAQAVAQTASRQPVKPDETKQTDILIPQPAVEDKLKKTGRIKKIVPDHEAIAEAAWKYTLKHRVKPQGVPGNEFLPTTSPSWSTLTIHYLKGENSLSNLMKRFPLSNFTKKSNNANGETPLEKEITLTSLAKRHWGDQATSQMDAMVTKAQEPPKKEMIRSVAVKITRQELNSLISALCHLSNKELSILVAMRSPYKNDEDLLANAMKIGEYFTAETIADKYPEGIEVSRSREINSILNGIIRNKLVAFLTEKEKNSPEKPVQENHPYPAP